ncbi:MAG: biotin/lipoyl-binding protein [Anaerolineales bacterium]|nr:biotin/lipoyl-binding protein [Anaerolineales bacterium]
MTVYRIFIGENEYQIEITETGVRINGEQIEADLLQLNEAGLYLLNHGEDKLELHLAFEGKNTFLVMADGQQIAAQVEPDVGQTRRTTGSLKDSKQITAPMPGVVVDVPIQVGDDVGEGGVLCILESMKMQMVIQSPAAGRVAEVLVKPNQNVDKGELLIRLE